MKNFSISSWNRALSEIDFSFNQNTNTIEEEAAHLSNKINMALDRCAPLKTFTVKPKYVHGLSQVAKNLMSDRDKTRSSLKNTNHSQMERQALMIKYRKIRNQATLQIKKDKQKANADRIK